MPAEAPPRPRGWPAAFAQGPGERRALLVLASLRGITARRLHELGWREGTASASLREVLAGRAGSEADRDHARAVDVGMVEAAQAACGARMLAPDDPEYPPTLLNLEDPPAALFVRGASLRRDERRVAVVGARSCSALGREVAADIGRALASAATCVVSGAARGIDSAAHRGALDAGGRTIAVLGSGIDVAYPAGSRGLIERIAETCSVVSEYAPGVPAEGFRFPARNRIVVALAEALVVVEGAGKSGTRTSVEHALDLGREVFAVPGPVTSPLAEVPLGIIREGATMIRGADDLLADLGLDAPAVVVAPPNLPDDERRVYSALAGPSLPDAVARHARLSIPEAVAALIRLELRGLVRGVGGRYERRLVPRPGGASAAPGGAPSQ